MDKTRDWDAFCKLIKASDEVTAGKPRSREALALMFTGLSAYTLDQVREAVSEHIKASPFAVKPADIVRHLEGSAEERAALAWRTFILALDRYAYYDSVRFPHPAYHYVIRQYGGWQAMSMEWHELTSRELEFRAPEWKRLFEVGMRVASWCDELGKVRVPTYLAGYYETHNRSIGGKHIPNVLEVATGRRIKCASLDSGRPANIIPLPNLKTGTEGRA